ncbi:ATP-binding cassette domain-containing protein [Arhodomonas sp. AD133]|uniref:ATP-binding cassette domain-containing protein n=1 Tax=Arhodomonas sp. AD133 TaxID=3415009 RepID=UPI003EB9CBCA
MISLRDITLRRGGDPLLEHASVTIHPGHKIGLVGANGSGKSTLFALLRGELGVDAGEVHQPGDWEVAHMAQETPAIERPALEFVLDGDRAFRAAERAVADADASGDGEAIAHAHLAYENAGGYTAHARAGELLDGLGFPAEQHAWSVAAFSGGWRVRLNLAQALMCRSDLLLLDEPTNHLDLEAVLWLEQWLRAYPGTLLLISHDRDFIDAVADETLHIEHRALTLYRGGYSAFERQRAERLAQQQAQYEKQQREIAHLQKFIDRFRAKATKARAAQSRVKALERMERVAPAHVDSPFSFEFPTPPEAANPLLSLEGVALGYSATPILQGVSMSLRPGARIGLLGPNGAGKSTLVRALAGELAPAAGTLTAGRNLSVGYFAQHQLEQLDPAASPLLHLRRLAPEALEQKLRDFLGGFGFQGDQATEAVAPLSGGEKARLVLALLVWRSPNLLLLDEPTNHLDLEMRHALTVALQGYEGAVVTVSHDRHLLNSTVDEYWLVADGAVSRFHGDLEAYREWLAERRRSGRRLAEETASGGRSAAERKADRQRAAAERRRTKPLRDRVEHLVREIERVSAALAEVETALADPAVYEDAQKQRLNDLLREQGALRGRHDDLEAEWMAAEEELAQAEA